MWSFRPLNPQSKPKRFAFFKAEMIALLLPHLFERAKRFQREVDANEAGRQRAHILCILCYVCMYIFMYI